MRRALCISVFGCLLASFGCQLVRPTSTPRKPSNNEGLAAQSQPDGDFQGVKTAADIAKLAWVNKRCRLWAADGDIDIDQTCLVVRTVRGSLVVIPNEYNDEEMKEVVGEMGRESKDKWIQRFYGIGGGEKRLR
jgi:hypothetical protein